MERNCFTWKPSIPYIEINRTLKKQFSIQIVYYSSFSTSQVCLLACNFNKTLGYYSTNPKTWLWFLLATARSCSSSLVWFSHTARLRAQQTNMPNQYAIPSKLCSQISIKSDTGLSKLKQTSSKRRGTYFVWGKSGNNWHLKDKQAPKASEQQSVILKVQEKNKGSSHCLPESELCLLSSCFCMWTAIPFCRGLIPAAN